MKGPILHTSYVTGRIVFNTIKRKFLSALPSCLKWNSHSSLNLNFGHVYVAHPVSYAAPSEHKETPVLSKHLSNISPLSHHSTQICLLLQSRIWPVTDSSFTALRRAPFKVWEASVWEEKMRKVWKIFLYSLFPGTCVFRDQMWAN